MKRLREFGASPTEALAPSGAAAGSSSGISPSGRLAFSGLIFDLDGTVLSDGRLTLPAYESLHRLKEHGFRLIACTGRPAGWGEVIARQWPLDLAVAENGAIGFIRQGSAVVRIDRLSSSARMARRTRLEAIAQQLRQEFADLVLADDNLSRLSDITFDIGETQSVAADRVATVCARAAELGLRTFTSSIHLHITFDSDDKATGTLNMLAQQFGHDRTNARRNHAFIGDSANDAACFAGFHTTFAVANVVHHLAALNVPPRFVSKAEQGDGFVEIARHLCAVKDRCGD